MEDNNPTAQGQDTQQSEPQNDQTTNEVPPGVQARFDEFRAKLGERDRAIEQLMLQNNELLGRLAMLSQQQSQPQQVEEPLDLSPEEMRKLDRFISQRVKPLEEKIREQEQFITTAQQRAAEEEVAAKLAKLNNPMVTARVNQLMAGWKQHPVYRNATKKDAFLIAMGEASLGTLEESVERRNALGQFNSASAPVVTSHAGRQASSRSTNRQAAAVAAFNAIEDLNDLSPDELMQYTQEIDRAHPQGIAFSKK